LGERGGWGSHDGGTWRCERSARLVEVIEDRRAVDHDLAIVEHQQATVRSLRMFHMRVRGLDLSSSARG
jgi:hypothetical protein